MKKNAFDSELVEKSKFTPVAVQFGPVDIKSRSRWLIRAMPAWARGFKVFLTFFFFFAANRFQLPPLPN